MSEPLLPPTWLMALEAKKLSHDLRVKELRGLAAGLRERAPGPGHAFWSFGTLLAEVAQEYEELAAEWFALKKRGSEAAS